MWDLDLGSSGSAEPPALAYKRPLRSRPSPTYTDTGSSLAGPLQAGRDALARGRWNEAGACFEHALEEAEFPEAFEGLGMACWRLEDQAARQSLF